MKSKYLAPVLILFLFYKNSSGFGKKGHILVSQIGWHYCTQKTKERVTQLLGNENVMTVSTWMDDIRNKPQYDSLKPWHYINTDVASTQAATNGKVENIMDALSRCCLKLGDTNTSKQEQTFYLKCLIHLVGDIHQPLHAGYQKDKGGNSIHVDFLGHDSNLHKVWDTDILEYFADNDSTISHAISDSLYKVSCSTDIHLWLSQSINTLQAVYDYKSTTLSMEYIETSHKIIINKIAIGGIRLACLLNSIYDQAK